MSTPTICLRGYGLGFGFGLGFFKVSGPCTSLQRLSIMCPHPPSRMDDECARLASLIQFILDKVNVFLYLRIMDIMTVRRANFAGGADVL